MAKSRSEIQKAYRERKKAKEGKKYLNKETDRVKRYYKPTTELSCRALKTRRLKIKYCMQTQRNLLRQLEHGGHNESLSGADTSDQGTCDATSSNQGPCDSTVVEPGSSTNQLNIKMTFNKAKRGGKGLKIAKKKIHTLEIKLKNAKRHTDKLRKRLSRTKHVTNSNSMTPTGTKRNITDIVNMTPRSKSKAVVLEEGLTPAKHPRLVKQLTFHNTIVEEIKESLKPVRGRSTQRTALNVLCGKIIKRYRMQSNLCKSININQHQIRKARNGSTIIKKRQAKERKLVSEKVVQFLEREDNSSCLPGKADVTKVGQDKIQTRVLNDYLYNLHLKFKSENSDMNISLTTFTSYRPKYIKLVHFSSRRTCLCQRHQNLALKAKALKSIRVTTTDNPDALIRQNTDEEIINKIRNSEQTIIKFSEWKRVDVEHKGRKTKRMQIVNIEKSKEDFVEIMQKNLLEFREHNARVKCQYEQIRLLKETLPENNIICQMDFAENYSCSHADEIQSAYFDKGSVTLHPTVIYSKEPVTGNLKHKAHVFVSDTPSHTSGTVYAFMKQIIAAVKTELPSTNVIHYYTDSPTSQYRNKHMMHLIANHKTIFGIDASWQYFEAGHGKGPCDGVGGTAKRLADSAVKRQTVIIQTAEDFFNWGTSLSKSQINYVYVPQSKCDEAQEELSKMNVKPVKGTMAVHSVVPLGNCKIAVRSTSCFCSNCFNDGEFHPSCDGWKEHDLQQKETCNPTPAIESSDGVEHIDTQLVVDINEPIIASDDLAERQPVETTLYPVNSYVAAVYESKWYIGRIIEYDDADNDYNISFMTEGGNKRSYTFRWPDKADTLWIQESSILCIVDEPVLHGKTRQLFKLTQPDIQTVLSLFEN